MEDFTDIHISGTVTDKPNLKRKIEETTSDADEIVDIKKSRVIKKVMFKNIEIFHFKRKQGFCAVPLTGGTTLGMDHNHHDYEKVSLLEYVRTKSKFNKVRRKISKKTTEDVEESNSFTDHAEIDGYYLTVFPIEPVTKMIRGRMLKSSGIKTIDKIESSQCQELRDSRVVCGCRCLNGVCIPGICTCITTGITCQVDNNGKPCNCTKLKCANQYGFMEYSYDRVRRHIEHSIFNITSTIPLKSNWNSTDNGSCKKCVDYDTILEKASNTPTRCPSYTPMNSLDSITKVKRSIELRKFKSILKPASPFHSSTPIRKCISFEEQERDSTLSPIYSVMKLKPKHMRFNNDEVDEKPQIVESQDKPQIIESQDKPQFVESQDKPQIVESHDIPHIIESHDIPQIIESQDKSQIIESQDKPQIVESQDKPQIIESHDIPQIIESHDIPQIIESQDKSQIIESQDKSQFVESQDKSQIVESQDKSQIVESQDIPQIIESQDKSQIIESQDKSQFVEYQDKSQIVESQDKSQFVESQDKSQIVESQDKSQIVEYQDKSQIVESQDKSQIVESQDKPQIIESQDKPQIVESQDIPQIIESQDKSQIIETQDKPHIIESQDKPQIIESQDKPQIIEPQDNSQIVESQDKELYYCDEADDISTLSAQDKSMHSSNSTISYEINMNHYQLITDQQVIDEKPCNSFICQSPLDTIIDASGLPIIRPISETSRSLIDDSRLFPCEDFSSESSESGSECRTSSPESQIYYECQQSNECDKQTSTIVEENTLLNSTKSDSSKTSSTESGIFLDPSGDDNSE